MEFTCVNTSFTQKQVWTGICYILDHSGSHYELEIKGRGTSFHALIGKHSYGNYICIPSHKVGCDLADYSDVNWNYERLSQQLKPVDATTIVYALTLFKD